MAAFSRGLAEGIHVGQNVAIEFRWAEGQYERFPELAADLVRRKVSVIATPASATRTRGQGGYRDDSDHFRHRRGPSEARARRQPQSTRRQCDGGELFYF